MPTGNSALIAPDIDDDAVGSTQANAL